MLILGDVYKIILKYLDVNDYVSLCSLDKNNNQYIKNNKHYIKFKSFFTHDLTFHFQYSNIEYYQITKIEAHKYYCAILSKCNKLMSYLKVEPMSWVLKGLIMSAAMRTDNLDIFNLYYEKCDYLESDLFKYESHKIIQCHPNISRRTSAHLIFSPYFLTYVCKYNHMVNKQTFTIQLDTFFELPPCYRSHNCKMYHDIANVLIKTNFDYNLLDKLNHVLLEYKKHYNYSNYLTKKRKLRVYIKYHLPLRFKKLIL